MKWGDAASPDKSRLANSDWTILVDEKQQAEKKFLRMTEAPVERLVTGQAIPSMIIMLTSAMYNLADSFFVGRLGTSATAAVGIGFPLMGAIQAVGFFFGHGAGNYISRELGAQRRDNAVRMASTGFFTALIFGGLIGVGGLLTLDRLALWLGSTPTILPHAREYLTYILVGTPWMASSLMLNNLLRFQGSAIYGMVGMISGAVLNVLLDPLFIFTLDMGVAGASLATMISQFLGFTLLLVGCSRKDNIRIRFSAFSPSLSSYREIMRGGFPSLCRQGLASLSVICLNLAAGGHGDAVIAAISIVQRALMIAVSILIGLGQGFQPVCGFNYGAKRYDRVKKALWFCLKISVAWLLVLAAACFVYAPDIVRLFRDDPHVIEVGALSMRLQCLTLPFMSWAILNNMMLQTIGKAVKASILAMSRQGLFLLPSLYILEPRLGVLGIQLAQPISDMATFLLALPLGIGVLREMSIDKTASGRLPES